MSFASINPVEMACAAAHKYYILTKYLCEIGDVKYYDFHATQVANYEISHCFKNHKYITSYFDKDCNFWLIFDGFALYGDVKLKYSNKEAITLAQNAVEVYENAKRIEELI